MRISIKCLLDNNNNNTSSIFDLSCATGARGIEYRWQTAPIKYPSLSYQETRERLQTVSGHQLRLHEIEVPNKQHEIAGFENSTTYA